MIVVTRDSYDSENSFVSLSDESRLSYESRLVGFWYLCSTIHYCKKVTQLNFVRLPTVFFYFGSKTLKIDFWTTRKWHWIGYGGKLGSISNFLNRKEKWNFQLSLWTSFPPRVCFPRVWTLTMIFNYLFYLEAQLRIVNNTETIYYLENKYYFMTH